MKVYLAVESGASVDIERAFLHKDYAEDFAGRVEEIFGTKLLVVSEPISLLPPQISTWWCVLYDPATGLGDPTRKYCWSDDWQPNVDPWLNFDKNFGSLTVWSRKPDVAYRAAYTATQGKDGRK